MSYHWTYTKSIAKTLIASGESYTFDEIGSKKFFRKYGYIKLIGVIVFIFFLLNGIFKFINIHKLYSALYAFCGLIFFLILTCLHMYFAKASCRRCSGIMRKKNYENWSGVRIYRCQKCKIFYIVAFTSGGTGGSGSIGPC